MIRLEGLQQSREMGAKGNWKSDSVRPGGRGGGKAKRKKEKKNVAKMGVLEAKYSTTNCGYMD